MRMSDVKKSFRSLSLKYHPDKNKDENAEKIFRNIVAVVDVGVVDNVADGIVAVVEGIVASDPPVVHMEQVDQTAAALNEVG